MTTAFWLALRSVRHAWGRSLLIAGCLAIALSLPIGGRVVSSQISSALTARTDAVPLVIGATGSRFDLVFGSLYHRPTELEPVPHRLFEELIQEPDAVPVPVVSEFTARGARVISTSIEFFEELRIGVQEGRLFTSRAECVIGAQAAEELGLSPGDTLTTDAVLAYDITQPPTIQLRVVGVLAPTIGPDDRAIFTDLETGWIIAGFAHGHEPASEIKDERLLLGEFQDHIVVSQAAPTLRTVSADNASQFHLHGSRDELPLTSILVFPKTPKAETILSARFNADPSLQAIRPRDIAAEVLSILGGVRTAADITGTLLILVTGSLAGLILLLIHRMRIEEMRSLTEMGAPRRLVAWTLLSEAAILAVAGLVLSAGTTASLALLTSRLIASV